MRSPRYRLSVRPVRGASGITTCLPSLRTMANVRESNEPRSDSAASDTSASSTRLRRPTQLGTTRHHHATLNSEDPVKRGPSQSMNDTRTSDDPIIELAAAQPSSSWLTRRESGSGDLRGQPRARRPGGLTGTGSHHDADVQNYRRWVDTAQLNRGKFANQSTSRGLVWCQHLHQNTGRSALSR